MLVGLCYADRVRGKHFCGGKTHGLEGCVRVHISALSSEQVCASLSQTKNRVKDEGRSDNQLRVRAQALQPERPWPLDEEVLRGGGV